MPMRPRSGRQRVVRQRKSCARSSAEGALNENTWQPCGFTPDITCLIVLALPAASLAWKLSSSAHVPCAYNFSCSSRRRSTPLARRSAACCFDSRPPVSSGSTCFRRNFRPPAIMKGRIRRLVSSIRLDRPIDGCGGSALARRRLANLVESHVVRVHQAAGEAGLTPLGDVVERGRRGGTAAVGFGRG